MIISVGGWHYKCGQKKKTGGQRRTVTKEAETGFMWPGAKKCRQLLESGRNKEWILVGNLQTKPALQTP